MWHRIELLALNREEFWQLGWEDMKGTKATQQTGEQKVKVCNNNVNLGEADSGWDGRVGEKQAVPFPFPSPSRERVCNIASTHLIMLCLTELVLPYTQFVNYWWGVVVVYLEVVADGQGVEWIQTFSNWLCVILVAFYLYLGSVRYFYLVPFFWA